jgi:putative ABC transport system permease protein
MLMHDVTIALRRLARRRFETAVGVTVLTLGLLCFVAANLFVGYVHNYDRHWPNAARIHVVAERMRASDFGLTPSFDTRSDAPVADILRVEAPELAAVARLHLTQRLVLVDDRRVPLAVAYAEPQFTDIFELAVLTGDVRQALATPRSAVITRDAAERLFGAADGAHRSLTLMARQPVELTIKAVVADLPDQSHLRRGGLFANGADIFVSWDVLEAFEQVTAMSWGGRAVTTYALLPENGSLSLPELDRRLAEIAAERVPADFRFLNIDLEARPISAVAALTAQNVFQGYYGETVWVDIFGTLRIAAAAILAIACLNFLNLAMAQGTGRALDVSTRKVLGAKTRQIIGQDLVQTGLVVALALLLAICALVPVSELLAAPWSSSLALPWNERWFVVLLGGTLCAVTLAAGLYPALVAARARRAAAFGLHGASDALARVRTALVGLQVAAASALVVGAIV